MTYWALVEMLLQSLKFNGAFWKTKSPQVQAGILFYKIPCIVFFCNARWVSSGYLLGITEKNILKIKKCQFFLLGEILWAGSSGSKHNLAPPWAGIYFLNSLLFGQYLTFQSLTNHSFLRVGGGGGGEVGWDWVSQGQSFKKLKFSIWFCSWIPRMQKFNTPPSPKK